MLDSKKIYLDINGNDVVAKREKRRKIVKTIIDLFAAENYTVSEAKEIITHDVYHATENSAIVQKAGDAI